MHRTNVYLTEEQERALDARAQAEGVSRSDVLRSVLDRELGLGHSDDPELDAALVAVADLVGARAWELARNDRDLSSE